MSEEKVEIPGKELAEDQAIFDAMEVAEQEFDRWADAWRIDTEVLTMDEDDAEDFKNLKRKVLLSIRRGDTTITAEGNLHYKLFQPVGRLSEVEVKRPKGAAYFDMDKSKDGKNMNKMGHFLAAAIGEPIGVFAKMDGVDMKYFQVIYNLFLDS